MGRFTSEAGIRPRLPGGPASRPKSCSLQQVVTSSSVSGRSVDGAAALLVGVRTEDEGLAAAENFASSALALGAFKPESNFLCLFSLSSEDGLGLAAEALLLGGVAPVSLGSLVILALLILSHLVLDVLVATRAVGPLHFGSMHLKSHAVSILFLQSQPRWEAPLRSREDYLPFCCYIN